MLTRLPISQHHILPVLQVAGLLVPADFSTVASRMALTGTASFLDVLFLVPGMHCQQALDAINYGKFPKMPSKSDAGHVFCVENLATVRYLRTIGRTGHDVTAQVLPLPCCDTALSPVSRLLQSFFVTGVPATLVYILGPVLTVVVVALLGVIRDWCSLGVLGLFMLSRLINVIIIMRRSLKGWKDMDELSEVLYFANDPDVLTVLDEDDDLRVHLRGSVVDLNTVTKSQWLRDKTMMEEFVVSFATLLVYTAVILAFNSSTVGRFMIACLLLCSSILLGLCNSLTSCLQMSDCIVRVEEVEKYKQS